MTAHPALLRRSASSRRTRISRRPCGHARGASQPIFNPVLNEEYATKIARDWNTKDPASGYVGHVLRFEVDAEYLRRFPPRRAGGAGIDELWIPAEQLEEFNDHIIG